MLPHWPGETQNPSLTINMKTSAKLVGFQMCFPFQRSTNLLAIAITAVSAPRRGWLVRARKQSPSPEISALLESNLGSRQIRVQTYWVPRAEPRVRAIWKGEVPKRNQISE